MADDAKEITDELEDFIDEPRSAAEASVAVSAAGALNSQLESVAQMIVEYANKEQGTHLFGRAEPTMYAKMQYLLALTKAVGEGAKNGGFHFPDFDENLIRRDYQLRTSVKQQTRKILESITKIFERVGESRPRGLFRR